MDEHDKDEKEHDDAQDEQRPETAGTEDALVSVSRESTEFSGPLPHPSLLAQYEQIQKGAADRILRMAEEQGQHRREIEKSLVDSNTRNEHVGMWLAAVLTVVFMIAGFYLILHDKTVAGFLAAFGPVVFHAGNYFYTRHQRGSKTEE